jgi:hypothetical protein
MIALEKFLRVDYVQHNAKPWSAASLAKRWNILA